MWPMGLLFYILAFFQDNVLPKSSLTQGAFHLRRLAGNVASKLGNAYSSAGEAYLRFPNRQPATCNSGNAGNKRFAG